MLKNPSELRFQKVRAWHRGQLPVLGARAQQKLLESKVVIVGCGRIGSSFALAAHTSGVGQLVLIDGQAIEHEQLGPFIFAHPADLGRPKVTVLERFFAPRQHGMVEGIPLPVERADLHKRIADTSLIVCCANDPHARLFVEHTAIAAGVPAMQVAAYDSRDSAGGMITLWTPERRQLACYGCLLGATQTLLRPSALLTSVTGTLAQLGAHLAVAVLTGIGAEQLLNSNLFLINLEQLALETLSVERRPDCRTCGTCIS